MTLRQTLCLCIAVSFSLHMWALDRHWDMTASLGNDEIIIPSLFDVAAAMTDTNALALEQAADQGDDQRHAHNAAKQRRRQAQRHFFKRISQAVEQRKFQSGRDLSGLIGNALYSFRVLPDDTFSDIRLRRSSGDAILDRAALNAIRAASGRAKRPTILKGQTFTLSIAVKYQLNL